MTFLPTSPPLARALAERNYDRPTPVQTAVLADEAAGRDLLVSAQTGSGKTVAYRPRDGAELCSATPSASAAPARRWRWSSRRRASWRCRSSAS